MRVADVIIKILEEEGVKYIFGMPGGQLLPIYDALYESCIKHILVRHEQAAAFMADAYTKLTGKLGVCMGTVGPGALNLITGVYNSWVDSRPVLALGGQNPVETFGKGCLQEAPEHVEIFRPITKWSTLLSEPAKTAETMRKAIRLALTSKPGPVFIDLPVDVLGAEIEYDGMAAKHFRFIGATRGDSALIERAAALLSTAKRPVLIAGGGCVYNEEPCHREVTTLAELLDMPTAATWNGIGAIPHDHPLALGRIGQLAFSYTNEFVSESDVILAVGCRFSGMSTDNWTIVRQGTKIIQIDIDPAELGRNYPVEIGIVGDSGSVLKELISILEKRKPPIDHHRRDLVEKRRSEWLRKSGWEEKATTPSIPLRPQYVCRQIRQFFGRESIVLSEAGYGHYLSSYEGVFEPQTWVHTGSGGPMGYSLPAAIACKLVYPEREVVAYMGDGGFAINCQELMTTVQLKVPIIVVILNNQSLGYIRHMQERLFDGRYIGVDLQNPDFAQLAKGFGCHGIRVETPDQLLPALKIASEMTRFMGRTVVIDFIISREERPYGFNEMWGGSG